MPNIPAGFSNIREKFGDIRKLMFTKFCDISSHNLNFELSKFAVSFEKLSSLRTIDKT